MPNTSILNVHPVRALVAGLLSMALLVAAPPPVAAQTIEQPDIKMTLGWTFIASQLMFIYGVEKGFFKEEGLNVTLDRGAGAGVAIQRVASGVYQFGYADIGTLTRYNAENRSRALLAVYIAEDDSPQALFTLQGKGIAKPKDIEGKRIGVSQFDGARQMLPVLRFTAPVAPGETLRTELWAAGDTVSFRTTSVERGAVVLDRGHVDLHPKIG